MRTDCLIVGAGQAGLVLAAILAKKNITSCILERDPQVGDVWRRRPDSMILFTNRATSNLPGFPFHGQQAGYPDKHETADYLQRYAQHHNLNIFTNTEAVQVSYANKLYSVQTSDGRVFTAPCLINATGANQAVDVPSFASSLANEVMQLTIDQYQNPLQLASAKKVAIIGDGSSGRQLAKELAPTKEVILFCGKQRPFLPDQILGKSIFWWLIKTGILFADSNGFIGKILQKRNPIPCWSIRDKQLIALGVQFTTELADIKGSKLIDGKGAQYSADAVIWSVGYKEDTRWLTLPNAVNTDGFICQTGHKNGGKTPYPGLYMVGRKWLSSRSSELIQGSARDAERVAKWIESYLSNEIATN